MALNSSLLVLPGAKIPPGTVALDFGGSLAKIAYFPNKTEASTAADALLTSDRKGKGDVLAQEPSRKSVFIKPGSVSKLRVSYEKKADETIKEKQAAAKGGLSNSIQLVSVPLGREKDIVGRIREACDIPPNSQGQRLINVTGVSTAKAWTFLQDNLGVKLNMHDEMSASVLGFKRLLQHLGPDGFLETYTDDAIEEAFKIQVDLHASLTRIFGQEMPKYDDKASPLAKAEELFNLKLQVPSNLSKYILSSLGSGAISIKVDGDHTDPWLDAMTGVGKTFHALGKLITGKQSYDELVALALRGNPQNVHNVIGDMVPPNTPTGASNMYCELPSDSVAYFLGKVTDPSKKREDFAPEDLMAGLLDMTCSNIVYRCYNVALASAVEHVFFLGGFVDNVGVRKVMGKHALVCMMSAQKKVQFHFTKYPNYVEVIGGLLTPNDDSKNNNAAANGQQETAKNANETPTDPVKAS